ncbi:MAG: zinc metallopeptidase [Bacteroidetes bacterium]|nr:zinc metallopeptidase [Bacteroidota bacterium]MBU1373978.1 zinc metallopeptidase [Bacteroidota bacterium]MBU1485294.1 zinc metallopeptidase [Bacteroidota bacterium]MBU1761594.1 zinc metallopeptidase [Bacteroidota bacterium]MBU2046008.1 zinc metallopeptidase [Bacteroidota bacterium]
MKWMGRSRSGNIDDRRGMSSGGKFLAGGGIIGVIALLAQMFIGGDTGRIIGQIANQVQVNNGTEQRDLTPEELQQQEFVDVVLTDVDSIWTIVLKEKGENYKKPTLVLFYDGVQTECGGASSATGPFYCPADQNVYMDLGFMNEMTNRFGAKGGDFAMAYIIAHEVGHHVQNLLGTSEEMQRAQQGLSKAQANKLSVALELQADFYAGIFAHYDKQYLDVGDIEEALSAANAVGDDAIQQKTQGRIVPDAFTHGTSKQRMYWFTKGYQTGDISQGDTFSEMAN